MTTRSLIAHSQRVRVPERAMQEWKEEGPRPRNKEQIKQRLRERVSRVQTTDESSDGLRSCLTMSRESQSGSGVREARRAKVEREQKAYSTHVSRVVTHLSTQRA